MSKNNNIMGLNSRYGRTATQLLFAIAVILAIVSCTKESQSIIGNDRAKKTVVDYILDRENLYLIQYRFQYNEYYQVTHIYRGERFADPTQLQIVAEAFYSSSDPDQLPDSLVAYNTKGFKAGTIYPSNFNNVADVNLTTDYVWPERRNKLLTTPGGRLALAISGSEIDWAGDGHLGSGNEIKILDNVAFINRSSIKDSVQRHVDYSTDGSDIAIDNYLIQYNKFGYPIDISFYDLYNAGFETAKINYREE